MGYMHISNLYADQDILMFKEAYACQKIHGTSGHIAWHFETKQLTLFSGGEKHDKFCAMFDLPVLTAKFEAEFPDRDCTVFGEIYGGKQQGMAKLYGPVTKFIAFEVKIGEHSWLSVPDAEAVALKLGLEFVWYTKTTTDLAALDALLHRESEQAVRNGTGRGLKEEGIVLHPLIELRKNNGARILAKHKHPDFTETKTPRKIEEGERERFEGAERIATEYVTEMRLEHVLDKLQGELNNSPEPRAISMSDTGRVLSAMVEDVLREGAGEFEDTKDVRRAISKLAATMFKARLLAVLKETHE